MNYLARDLRLEPREPVRVRPQRPGQHTTTVDVWGFPMLVTYEYDPGEPCVMWPTEAAHPGSPAGCSVESVLVGGVDILEMLNDKQHEHIEAALMELHE